MLHTINIQIKRRRIIHGVGHYRQLMELVVGPAKSCSGGNRIPDGRHDFAGACVIIKPKRQRCRRCRCRRCWQHTHDPSRWRQCGNFELHAQQFGRPINLANVVVDVNGIGLRKCQRICADGWTIGRTCQTFLQGVHHICEWQGSGDRRIIFGYRTQGIVVGVDGTNRMLPLCQCREYIGFFYFGEPGTCRLRPYLGGNPIIDLRMNLTHPGGGFGVEGHQRSRHRVGVGQIHNGNIIRRRQWVNRRCNPEIAIPGLVTQLRREAPITHHKGR